MTDDMQEIITDFVTEAEESLDRIDPLFVELETNGEDKEILNDIFRCMHTLERGGGIPRLPAGGGRGAHLGEHPQEASGGRDRPDEAHRRRGPRRASTRFGSSSAT